MAVLVTLMRCASDGFRFAGHLQCDNDYVYKGSIGLSKCDDLRLLDWQAVDLWCHYLCVNPYADWFNDPR